MKSKSMRSAKKSIYLFVLAFVSYALVYLTKNCFSAAMASIVDQGVMTKTETGLISAVFYLVYAPFQVIGGIAADRISPQKLILLGYVGGGICNLLIYFIDSYIAILAIWACNAIVQFGVWPSIFKIVSTQLAPKHRMGGVCYINLATTLGLFMSYVSVIFITDWKDNFILSAIILFVTALVFFVVSLWLDKDMVEEEVKAPVIPGKKVNLSGKETTVLLLKAGIPLILISAMIQTMISTVKSLVPVMLMESYEFINPGIANALNIILVACSPLGLFLSRLRIFRKFTATTVIAMGFGIMIPLILVVSFVGNVNIILIVSALTLIMITTSCMTVFFGYVSSKFNVFGCSGTLSGLVNCMSALGMVIANYVFAALADSFGWKITMLSCLGISFGAFVVAVIAVPIWKHFLGKMKI